MTYKLDAIQVVIASSQTTSCITSESDHFCLHIISSSQQHRAVYFETELSVKNCHAEILKAQGFLEKRIEQYVPMGRLGRGAFGIVLLGKHKYSGIKVAIKVIDKKVIQETFDVNGQVFDELEIMKEVSGNCPNVIELVESFEDENSYYCVTRYMAGGDLYKYITTQPNQPLLEAEAKIIIKQVATGLQALHRRNIIHRDIKLDNILVASKMEETKVYIGDLGSAIKL